MRQRPLLPPSPRHAVALLCAALLGVALTTPREAAAEPTPHPMSFAFGTSPNWYGMTGLTGGYSFGEYGPGGFVGAEVSVVRLHKGVWAGLYADGFWDFSQRSATITVGPELGYLMFGLDGGLGVRFGDGVELGGQARLLLSLGLFSLYGRWGIWPTPDRIEHVGQVGVLLKFPVLQDPSPAR